MAETPKRGKAMGLCTGRVGFSLALTLEAEPEAEPELEADLELELEVETAAEEMPNIEDGEG